VKRQALLAAALAALGCGGEVERSPPSKNPPSWPKTGCPPAFELRDGRCQVRDIYVPGGTFVMGRGYCPKAGALETPPDFDCPLEDAPHEVTVAPFWVDATLETGAAFGYFVTKDCPTQEVECAPAETYAPTPETVGLEAAEGECHVTRDGRHLLTEMQWDFIATWGGTRTYPWGEDPPTCERANIDANQCPPKYPAQGEQHDLARTMSYPPSPEGIYDLIGNAAQLVAPSPEAYGAHYTDVPSKLWLLRGGSTNGPPERFKAAFRAVNRGSGENDIHGVAFRCAHAVEVVCLDDHTEQGAGTTYECQGFPCIPGAGCRVECKTDADCRAGFHCYLPNRVCAPDAP
jgi:formylglycine-generating enzyme required for sulfatase activity